MIWQPYTGPLAHEWQRIARLYHKPAPYHVEYADEGDDLRLRVWAGEGSAEITIEDAVIATLSDDELARAARRAFRKAMT